jgi:cytochrome P450 family 4
MYFVVLTDPADVEKVLTSSALTEKGDTYNFFVPWLGEGLLISKGKKWQRRRKLLTPSFHFRILEDFLVIFNEQSNVFIEILREDFRGKEGKDICPYISRCTLDIMGETAMDQRFDAQRKKDTPYLNAVNKACEILQYRAIRPWFWINLCFNLTPAGRQFNAAVKTLHDFTDKVIKERQALGAESPQEKATTDVDEIYWHGKRRLAFLDLLLDAQKNPENNLSDKDIREEVDTFMFEGHDTTSASLGWTVFLLGCHQEFQAKVHEELDRIFEGDRTRPITTKDMAEMKYLEMCIKEALRLFPSVPYFSRTTTTDLVLDDDHTVPAGTDIVLTLMAMQRNADIFNDPNAYIPDRFLPENVAKRHPFAFIPFSAGPRNCIGQKFAIMEEKVILANLFRNFNVEAVESLADITVMTEVITRPKNGFKIRLIERESHVGGL